MIRILIPALFLSACSSVPRAETSWASWMSCYDGTVSQVEVVSGCLDLPSAETASFLRTPGAFALAGQRQGSQGIWAFTSAGGCFAATPSARDLNLNVPGYGALALGIADSHELYLIAKAPAETQSCVPVGADEARQAFFPVLKQELQRASQVIGLLHDQPGARACADTAVRKSPVHVEACESPDLGAYADFFNHRN